MSNVNVIEKNSVEYMYEDTKARDMLGVKQDDTLVAKQAYSVGNLFWYNNKLYRVIQAVASGATMVIDTDCVETDLEIEREKAKNDGAEIAMLNDAEIVRETVGWVGKNLVPGTLESAKLASTAGTWNGNVYSVSDVDFTVYTNSEGYITSINVNGTASADAIFELVGDLRDTDTLVVGETYTTTGCPAGGGSNTYGVTVRYTGYDFGEGKTFKCTEGILTASNVWFGIIVFSGTSVSNKVFYPMLRKASITDSTYEPYHEPVEKYLNSIFDTDSDDKPYVFRKGKGTLAKIKKLVGGTIAWNQLVQNGNFADTSNWNGYGCNLSVSGNVATIVTTNNWGREQQNVNVISGHKYLIAGAIKCSVADEKARFLLADEDTSNIIYTKTTSVTDWTDVSGVFNANVTALKTLAIGSSNVQTTIYARNIMLIDLTQMFGSTIADAIYALETTTEGAGVEWFRKYFPKAYYAYDAGSLQSVNIASKNITSKNLLPYPFADGSAKVSNGITFIVNGDGSITANGKATGDVVFSLSLQNNNKLTKLRGDFIATVNQTIPNGAALNFRKSDNSTIWGLNPGMRELKFSLTDEMHLNGWIYFYAATNTEIDNLTFYPMLRLASVADDTYEPYKEYTYSFDVSKQLRGIPKLVDNALQYDGDIYTPDGKITRKYGIVDLGTFTWTKGQYTGQDEYYFRTTEAIPGIKPPADNGAVAEWLICSKGYKPVSSNLSNSDTYSMFVQATSPHTGKFAIHDSAYNNTSAEDFKTAMSGVYLVYELATPTTENANSYQTPQRAFTDGIEEFIDVGSRDMVIPVGHDTDYDLNVTYPDIEDYADGKTGDTAKEIYGVMGENGAKNRLQTPYHHSLGVPIPVGGSAQNAGLTYTVNADGSVSVSETATADSYFIYNRKQDWAGFNLYGKKIKLSVKPVIKNVWFQLYDTDRNIRLFRTDASTGEVEFEMPSSLANNTSWNFSLNFPTGSILNGETFYCMLTLADDTDTDYQPYAMTNKELTEVKTASFTDVVGTLQGTSYIKRCGNVVDLCLNLSNVTTAIDSVIAKLPTGFRPSSDGVAFSVFDIDTTITPFRGHIDSSGNIVIHKAMSGGNPRIHCTFIV